MSIFEDLAPTKYKTTEVAGITARVAKEALLYHIAMATVPQDLILQYASAARALAEIEAIEHEIAISSPKFQD